MKSFEASPSLIVGSPAPDFQAATRTNPRFAFNTVADTYTVLVFAGDVNLASTQTLLAQLRQLNQALFNDVNAHLFLVVHGKDHAHPLTQDAVPGIRCFIDTPDLTLHALFKADTRRCAYVLDRRLVISDIVPLTDNPVQDTQRIVQTVQRRSQDFAANPMSQVVPILSIPRVFEPELCKQLIDYYHNHQVQDSGVTRATKDGKTYTELAHHFKRRKDCLIEDETLKHMCMTRIFHRIVPQLFHATQFYADRIERHIVACYDSQEGGFFRAHRDNTTPGTAHRKFAVTINLNAQDHTGGDIRFPEYSDQYFHTPTGYATVFSCSMLHEVNAVKQGTRYAYLPFLYDTKAAELRSDNLHTLQGI